MSSATLDERCIWKLPGMPRRGWTLVDVEDLGEPVHTCEACGKTEIRYVHTIAHPAFRNLDVGCICAEHLTEDYVNPRRQEQELRNAAARRQRQAEQRRLRQARRRSIRAHTRETWDELDWQGSRKGNLWAKVDDVLIVVFPARGGYRYVAGGEFSRETFEDENDAKRASLDGFEAAHRKGD
jgi:hypothetical protein